jgi:HTH-type transcriptional regulator / antitoxin HipB
VLTPSASTLAEIIKDRRRQLGLSQTEASDLVGLSQKTISAFELKPESTKLETFFKILSALNLEIHIVPKEKKSKSTQGWNEEW